MKKIIFFLITIISITLFKSTNVYASTVNFYEGEYINGIYMNKRAAGSNTIYYQKARFFREVGTNNIAYCIEPFNFFQEETTYESTFNPNNLTAYQKERISMIAHFGYGYGNHQDEKWYAITQFMIWQAADPTGNFYFTDTLNGNRVEKFTSEMNEINNLINNYQTTPSIVNKEYNLVEGENLNIVDDNSVLNNYQSSNENFSIYNNTLIANNLTEGTYEINLIRRSTIHNRPIIFYQATNSQNLVETGDIDDKNYTLKVNVTKTKLEITKIDNKTQTTTPSGDAELKGAVYELYDSNINKLEEIKIDEYCKGVIENLPFGKYYLKEIKAGIGYNIDDKIYEFTIDKENNVINLVLENKVIEAKIEINKSYENSTLENEANITFNIYNKNDELITAITTDEFGHAETYLPYGTYTIKQQNTTKGYYKVEDFKINIDNEETQIYNLTDYKIKVPNTKTQANILLTIIRLVLFLCAKNLF